MEVEVIFSPTHSLGQEEVVVLEVILVVEGKDDTQLMEQALVDLEEVLEVMEDQEQLIP